MTQEEFHKRFQYNPNEDCLGEGGFGKVYKAYDTHRDRYVAIKMAEVRPHLEEVRLKKEVEIISKLPSHPNIAYYEECYTFSTFAGEYDFGVLQYYEEGNLQQLLTDKQLSYEQKNNILRQILEGIVFLHSQGIIHRDLKPQNILIVNRHGDYIPKITDFGISKKLDENKSSIFTNSLAGAGTLSFASPEQLLGSTIRKNTDLWSFGVVACWTFTGNLPFNTGVQTVTSEAGRIELFRQITSGDISTIIHLIPSAWRSLINQCLKVDIDNRIGSATKCLGLLEKKVEEINKDPLLENTTINETIINTHTDEADSHSVIEMVIATQLPPTNETVINNQTDNTASPGATEMEAAKSTSMHVEPPSMGQQDPPNKGRIGSKNKTNYTPWIIATVVIVIGIVVAFIWHNGPSNEQLSENTKILQDAKQDSISRADSLAKTQSQTEQNTMVYLQGGTFTMGNNSGFADEKPLHNVTISNFYIDKNEVTIEDFARFVDETGYITDAEKSGVGYILDRNHYFRKKANINWRHDESGVLRDLNSSKYPVMRISWNDAKKYANWIGKRLPTEAEWEYAASGGLQSHGYKYSGSDDLNNIANYGTGQTQIVGMLNPNELGIYDMTGNVYEWCEDFFDYTYYKRSPETNPQGPDSGCLEGWSSSKGCSIQIRGVTSDFHVYRGGSCMFYQEDLRIKNRGRTYFNDAAVATLSGFRCAKN